MRPEAVVLDRDARHRADGASRRLLARTFRLEEQQTVATTPHLARVRVGVRVRVRVRVRVGVWVRLRV